MQDDPKNNNFLTPCFAALLITLVCIIRFSYMKSAGYSEFAPIPPTFAAARNTYSGCSTAKNI